MRIWVALVLALSLLPSAGVAQDGPSALAHACDILAVSPFDRSRPTDIAGVAAEKVDTQTALPACNTHSQQTPKMFGCSLNWVACFNF
jgi:hypothetical protein